MDGFVCRYGLDALLKFPEMCDTLTNAEIALVLTRAKHKLLGTISPDRAEISESYVSQLKRKYLRHGFKDDWRTEIEMYLQLKQSEIERLNHAYHRAVIIPITQAIGRSPLK